MRATANCLAVVLALSFAACGGAQSADNSSDTQNITTPPDELVDSGLWRGPRPTEAELNHLANDLGVKTIIDLENDDSAIAAEEPIATNLGMAFISAPMSGFWTPDDSEVDQIEAIIADPTQYPMFVHCQHGQDRTGLIIGIHRVEHDGWTPGDAYDEMIAKGFHKILVFLNHYYEDKTGFED